jgi:hypothetical protein
MINHFGAFLRRTKGIPWAERIMPEYWFADTTQPGTSTVSYAVVEKSGVFQIRQEILVTRPGLTDEVIINYFGPYYQKSECLKTIKRLESL